MMTRKIHLGTGIFKAVAVLALCLVSWLAGPAVADMSWEQITTVRFSMD